MGQADEGGGVADVVFGGPPKDIPPRLKPKKELNRVQLNKAAAARVVPIAERPRKVSGRDRRDGSRSAAGSDRGRTARPLPHTGRGLWVPEDGGR